MSKSTKSACRTALACAAAVLMVLACTVPAGASAVRASLGENGQYITDDGAYAVYVLPNDPGAVGIAQVLQGGDPAPASVMLNGVRVPVHATDTSAAAGAVLLPLPLNIGLVQQAVLDGANAIRARAGVAPVVLSDILSQAALVRATEMAIADEMSHTRPNGEQWPTIISGYGTEWAENIAMPCFELEDAGPVSTDLWENSEIHYNNIVNPAYTNIGVGCARGASGWLYICELLSNGDPAMDPSAVTIDTIKLNGSFTLDPDTLDNTPQPPEQSSPTEAPAAPTVEPADPTEDATLLTSGDFEVTAVGDIPVIAGMTTSSPTTVDALLACVELAGGGTLQLTDAQGEVRPGSAYAATGDQLWVDSGEGFAPTGFVVLVDGDVLGTGTSSLSQVVRLAKAFTGEKPLDAVHLAAADSNGDGQIGLTDLLHVASRLNTSVGR